MSEERISLPRAAWEEMVHFMKHAYNEACFITSASDFRGEGATLCAWGIANDLEKALEVANAEGRD